MRIFFFFHGKESPRSDALKEVIPEIHSILSKELEAIDLTDHDIVEGVGMSGGSDREVEDSRSVDILFEDERSQSELNDAEIEGCLLDAFIELDVIGEWALDGFQLRDKTREFAVEGNEVAITDAL